MRGVHGMMISDHDSKRNYILPSAQAPALSGTYLCPNRSPACKGKTRHILHVKAIVYGKRFDGANGGGVTRSGMMGRGSIGRGPWE
jgi:hypothetical protein